MIFKAIGSNNITEYDCIELTEENIESEELKEFLGDFFVCVCIDYNRHTQNPNRFVVFSSSMCEPNMLAYPGDIILQNDNELFALKHDDFYDNFSVLGDMLSVQDLQDKIERLENVIDELNTTIAELNMELFRYRQKEINLPIGPYDPMPPIGPGDPAPYYPNTPWYLRTDTPYNPYKPLDPYGTGGPIIVWGINKA